MSLATGLDYPYVATANTTLQATFNDAALIPDYAKESVAAALSQGIVVNYPNPQLFAPNQVISRGEMAALFCRVSADPACVIGHPVQRSQRPNYLSQCRPLLENCAGFG